MSKFGFTVSEHRKYWEGNQYIGGGKLTGEWEVYLPHQCGDWVIAGGNGDAESHDQAVKHLEDFLAEGAEALAALKAKQPFNGEED